MGFMDSTPSVTLGDVAKAAGVSRATVSRALKNNPVISAACRKQVQKIAQEMGYRPDPEASRLLAYLKHSRKAKFESVVGILNAHSPPEKMWIDPYTRALIAGAKRRAEAIGYATDELALTEPGMTPRRIDEILDARGIRGVLIPPEPEPLFQAGLDWSKVAAVATTTTAEPLRLHRVLPHNFLNMRLLIHAALDLGYRRIGLVQWPQLEERQMFAPTEVYTWFAHFAKRIPPLPVFEWNWALGEKVFPRVRSWFQKHKPDLVLGIDDYVLDALQEGTGLKAPHDFGYISYGEAPAGFSRLDQNPAAVGAAAIDMLSAQIHRGETGLPQIPKTMLIEGMFVPGSTTRRQ